MSIITKMLKDHAVYWPPIQPDKTGMPAWGDPVQIKCRWEVNDTTALSPEYEYEDDSAVVYVSIDVQPHGMLYHGVLASAMTSDPRPWGAQEIMKFEKIPDIKIKKFLRRVHLR